MLKPLLISAALSVAFFSFSTDPANAQGFSTLKAAGDGLDKSGGDDNAEDGGDSAGSSGGSGGKTKGSLRRTSTEDYLFMGVFETYNPGKRINIRVSVYGDPAEFKYADRTCQRMSHVRNDINTVLTKRPPKVDNRGKVQTEGVDRNIRLAVKNAMKTKREYFTSFIVVNGRYSYKNLPPEMEGKPVTDCAGVIEKAKELAKEK